MQAMGPTSRSNAPRPTATTYIKSWKWKSVEKVVAYLALLISSTKGFDQLAMPNNIRGWIIGGSAIVIAALHIGTDQ